MKTETCEIVQDLLPLYIDGALSDSSRNLVSGHLENCEDCRKIYGQMVSELRIAPDRENVEAPINRMKKNMLRTAARTFLIAVLVLSLIVSAAGIFISWPMLHGFAYADQHDLTVREEDGCAVLLPGGAAQDKCLHLIYRTNEDGSITMYISLGDMKAQYLFSLWTFLHTRTDWVYVPWEISENGTVRGGPLTEDGLAACAGSIALPGRVRFTEEVTEIYYLPNIDEEESTAFLEMIDAYRKVPQKTGKRRVIRTTAYDFSTLGEGTLMWRKE